MLFCNECANDMRTSTLFFVFGHSLLLYVLFNVSLLIISIGLSDVLLLLIFAQDCNKRFINLRLKIHNSLFNY